MPSPVARAPVPVNWTIGRKKVLYIRVRFADQVEAPERRRDAKRKMKAVNRFFLENSSGAFSLRTKITRTYVLTRTETEYTTLGIGAIRDDALAAALADGQNYADYDLDVIQYAGGPGADFSGAATIGGRGCWLRSTSAGVAIHELGHNLGLHHSNFWQTSDESVIGPGMHVEYGDDVDTMGQAIGEIFHFNARQKAVLGWLGQTGVYTVNASGLYRIYAHDTVDAVGTVRALTIPRDSSYGYWLELRQLFDGNRSMMDGAGLRRARFVYDAVGTQLLDSTPGSPDGKTDASLVIGRTFSDTEAGIHVTPIGKGGTDPESIDLVVQLGDFSTNRPPTLALEAEGTTTEIQAPLEFEAIATDPDGDALAYAWDFGDGTFGPNQPAVSKAWLQNDEYVVRCTAFDMKGGRASAFLVVSVGPVTTFRIVGRVTAGGLPLEGAHVHNGLLGSNNRGAYTDSAGDFVIAGVESGAHALLGAAPGYTLTPLFENPVAVGPDASGIDFDAEPVP